MAKKRGGPAMSETLRRGILARGETLYRVAKDSGVNYATLHRFVHGRRLPSAAALDKLCAYLGLKLMKDA